VRPCRPGPTPARLAEAALRALALGRRTSPRLTTPQPEHADKEGRERCLHAAGDESGAGDDDPQRVRVIEAAEPGAVPRCQGVERDREPCRDEQDPDDQT